MNPTTLSHNFTYHPPAQENVWLFTEVRERALELALWIEAHVPEGRERSVAITNLEQAVFWANAAIARRQQGE